MAFDCYNPNPLEKGPALSVWYEMAPNQPKNFSIPDTRWAVASPTFAVTVQRTSPYHYKFTVVCHGKSDITRTATATGGPENTHSVEAILEAPTSTNPPYQRLPLMPFIGSAQFDVTWAPWGAPLERIDMSDPHGGYAATSNISGGRFAVAHSPKLP